jgi:hypothetical protein
VADLSRSELQRLAQLGAKARLEELQQEEAAIRRAFPGLVGRRPGRRAGPGHPAGASRPAATRRRRSNMSAAARKAVSIRMKRYWAERRKEKAAKAK